MYQSVERINQSNASINKCIAVSAAGTNSRKHGCPFEIECILLSIPKSTLSQFSVNPRCPSQAFTAENFTLVPPGKSSEAFI